MSEPIVTIENLGKTYRLTHQAERQRYTTLRDVIADGVKRLIRRRTGEEEETLARTEDFWALKDVSLEIKQGEVVGIIGRNGAGKSTLLKILSRITEPTTGRIRIRGRVASLLEVGTGFHPELTGRENIYLNGAILGMAHTEIHEKFDEIVAFAEVERFLDTPVKRFSSGMYMRLAFAVAAHLEPEILIVDEVLAVGDGNFQKKCLGKMEQVSKKDGRTVLFVSHNMAAVKSLTNRGIVLSNGRVAFGGTTERAIQEYVRLSSTVSTTAGQMWGSGIHTRIRTARLVDSVGTSHGTYVPGEPLRLEIELETDGTSGMSLEVFLKDEFSSRIGMASTYQFHGQTLPQKAGVYTCSMVLEPIRLASGRYSLDIFTSVVNAAWDHSVESAIEFEVSFSNPLGREFDFKQNYGFGSLALLCSQSMRFEPHSGPVPTAVQSL